MKRAWRVLLGIGLLALLGGAGLAGCGDGGPGVLGPDRASTQDAAPTSGSGRGAHTTSDN